VLARTPLLRSLQRLSLEHHLSVTSAEARSRGISRRSFLGAAGAGAVALAVPRPARAAEAPRIAIVGAGIAGLSCALTLADHGISATVYEASERAGGRMFSNPRYFDEGQVAEWCGELIDSDNVTLQRLAARFGLALDDLRAGEEPGAEETYFFDGAYYPRACAERDFAAVYRTLRAEIASLGPETSYRVSTRAGRGLDAMDARRWIETRVPGGLSSPLGKLLEIAYVIEFGAPAEEQSALALVTMLGVQPLNTGLSLFGVSDERYHLRGGNQQLPEAIARALGPAVEHGHALTRLRRTPGDRYELTFARRGGTAETTADLVVLALPFAVLRDLDWAGAGFDDRKAMAIRDLGRAHNGKTQIQFTERLWRRRGPWPGISSGTSYTDTGYQNTWEVSRAQPGKSGILVFYSGGPVTDAMGSNVPFATVASPLVRGDVDVTLARAERVYPGLAARWNGRATQSLPHKSDLRKASYAYYRVGQITAFGGYERARQGGVLFCGEHTSTAYQGHMEGAASEGVRAAQEILGMLSIGVSPMPNAPARPTHGAGERE
jgi:monoamine oxidase